jgi:hypothetical protein
MLLINVINKLKKEGFVTFDGTNLLDGEGNIIDSIEDLGGTGNGSGQTLYIAYASNPQGAGFTLTPSTTLEYIAFKSSVTTPTANDFLGLWYHRKGLPGVGTPGTNGVNGTSAGFDVVMNLASVTMEDPGVGKIRFNTTTLANVAEIYLSDENPTGVDLSGVYNLLTTGTQLILRKKNSDTMAVFKLTAPASDQVGWFKLTAGCTAVSSTTFTEGDECTLQIFGGGSGAGTVTEQAVKDAGNFARFVDNGAGGYNLVDNTDNVIESASPVYRLVGSAIVGATDLPAANTFPHAAVVRLHEQTLTGSGANPMGLMIQADATNNLWRPFGRQFLFFNAFGLHASPTVTLGATGKFTIPGAGDLIIPAGLLYAGARVVAHIKYHKVGSTAPVIRMHLGTDQSVRTNNSMCYTYTTTATVLFDVAGRAEIDFISTTSARSSSRVPIGGAGVTNASNGGNLDCTALINTAQAMKLTVDATALSGDTVNLLELGLAWER